MNQSRVISGVLKNASILLVAVAFLEDIAAFMYLNIFSLWI